MAVKVFRADEKLEVIEAILESDRHNGVHKTKRHDVLKAVAADLRVRADRPRSLPLGEIERAIKRARESITSLGYDQRKLVSVAETLIHHWPFVSQALEHFGEESAE